MPARVFMIDNYDSFTYNLVQFLGELGAEHHGAPQRPGRRSPTSQTAQPTHLVVSPGPCTPNEAGISMEAIRHFGAERLPVLGVCLGHQAIGQVYGGVVRRAGCPCTARPTRSATTAPASSPACRSRSRPRATTRSSSTRRCPAELELTAWNDEGVVMGVRHRELPVHGVQFHPESVLTEVGLDLLRNFLELGRLRS